MPVYEYVCKKCGTAFEATRRIDDKDEEVQCPFCYEKECERLPSVFSSGSSFGSPGTTTATPRRFG